MAASRRERIPASRQYLGVDEKLRSGPVGAPPDFAEAFREHFAPVYRFIARRVGTDLLEFDARLAPVGTGSFADDADSRVVAAALAPRIAGALAALNAEQRDVLLLHAWAGLSHEEIAAALGIANGTARSRLSRARAALRAGLGDFDFTRWTFKEADHA
jgi:hypothetical protein